MLKGTVLPLQPLEGRAFCRGDYLARSLEDGGLNSEFLATIWKELSDHNKPENRDPPPPPGRLKGDLRKPGLACVCSTHFSKDAEPNPNLPFGVDA